MVTNYDSEDAHSLFLSECQKENNLAYASHRYGKIISGYQGDKKANQMIEQINEITNAINGMVLQSNAKVKGKRRVSWFLFILTLGVSLCLTGYFLPMLRNLVGVGVAIIFFKYYNEVDIL